MKNEYIHQILTPGAFPAKGTLIASIFAMLVVFILDVITPGNIRLHVLYIFPLAAVGIQCEKTSEILTGLAFSVAFQLSNFINNSIPTGPFLTDALVAFGTSLLTIYLARTVRKNHFSTVKLATTDWLTGLHNRRNFETITDLEIAKQKRYGGVFSLAFIDLDNFKMLNDAIGHRAGDMALQLLAQILREHTRTTDSIARLGGDEFAILIPNTLESDCQALCNHLSGMIEKMMAETHFDITASIGHTTFDHAPESTITAIQIADKAMYAAKRKGKKCVFCL